MNKSSLKNLLILAVIIGIIVGIGLAFAQTGPDNDETATAANNDSRDAFDPKKLPPEVLKALPPEELAQLFPEKAEAILNPVVFDQFKTAGGISNDPEYLRAVILKLGGEIADGSSTEELQDILARLSTSKGSTSK